MVVMGPQKSVRPLLVTVELEREGEEKIALEYIHLTAKQTGTEESTFTNEEQPVPWKIRLVNNVKEKRIQFEYSFGIRGVNVKRALEALRFHQAVAEGGVLRIVHLDTGFELQNYSFPPGTSTAPDSHWLKLLETLVFIQQKTQVPITVPHRDLTDDDFRAIFETAQILKAGQITYKAVQLTVGIDKESAHKWLEAFEAGRPQPIRLESEMTEEIFDVTIPLGPAILRWNQVYITEENRSALKAAVADNAAEEPVHVHLTPSEGCKVQAEYTRWFQSGEFSGDERV